MKERHFALGIFCFSIFTYIIVLPKGKIENPCSEAIGDLSKKFFIASLCCGARAKRPFQRMTFFCFMKKTTLAWVKDKTLWKSDFENHTMVSQRTLETTQNSL